MKGKLTKSQREFASVVWTPADVQTLRPDWSDDECYEFLVRHSKHIQDRLIELGWQVMEDLIITEGI